MKPFLDSTCWQKHTHVTQTALSQAPHSSVIVSKVSDTRQKLSLSACECRSLSMYFMIHPQLYISFIKQSIGDEYSVCLQSFLTINNTKWKEYFVNLQLSYFQKCKCLVMLGFIWLPYFSSTHTVISDEWHTVPGTEYYPTFYCKSMR